MLRSHSLEVVGSIVDPAGWGPDVGSGNARRKNVWTGINVASHTVF